MAKSSDWMPLKTNGRDLCWMLVLAVRIYLELRPKIATAVYLSIFGARVPLVMDFASEIGRALAKNCFRKDVKLH
ncbi:MAG: hypothetical protein CBC09_02475 [Cellvibrionales bacterium TMED49]|nr:MAG: hypothetical protein CBC09_02475 [Cellvibrionales bacterium TMED49]